MVGLEPTRPCGQQILSLSRLPFRHTGNSIIIAQEISFVKKKFPCIGKALQMQGFRGIIDPRAFQCICGIPFYPDDPSVLPCRRKECSKAGFFSE